MQLWQMDIVSGVPLADGRPAKLCRRSRYYVIVSPSELGKYKIADSWSPGSTTTPNSSSRRW